MKLRTLGNKNLEKYKLPDDMTKNMVHFDFICNCNSYLNYLTQWKEEYSKGKKYCLDVEVQYGDRIF